MKRLALALGLACALATGRAADTAAPTPRTTAQETPEQFAARLQWFRDAKFGLFIHWGPVSLQGTEISWSRNAPRPGREKELREGSDPVYDSLYRRFNPVAFDAREWLALAKEVGMKYVVFTARHHDGFTEWDSKVTDYKITAPDSPYGKDIVRQIADATHAAGLKLGFYYSQPDWHHPDAFRPGRHAKYQQYLLDQVRELMTQYGRVDILWYDGLNAKPSDYGAVALDTLARSLQPGLLINNRNGLDEDFDTPEQRVGHMQVDRPWESNITICRQWSWKPDDTLKSLDECVRYLVTTVTGDGNLLLNVGPMPDGRIEPRQVARLRELGGWVNAHAEAIYRTRGGPWRNGSWGGSTYRGNEIFVFLLSAPPGNQLQLGPLPHRITAASLLLGGKPVKVEQRADGVTLQLDPGAFTAPATVVRLTCAEPVKPGQIIGRAGGAFSDTLLYGTDVKPATVTPAPHAKLEQNADGTWNLAAQAKEGASAVFDLGAVRTVTAFEAKNPYRGFHGEAVVARIALSDDGEHWKPVWRGTCAEPEWEVPVVQFVAGIEQPGVPARYVRFTLQAEGPEGRDAQRIGLDHARLFAKP